MKYSNNIKEFVKENIELLEQERVFDFIREAYKKLHNSSSRRTIIELLKEYEYSYKPDYFILISFGSKDSKKEAPSYFVNNKKDLQNTFSITYPSFEDSIVKNIVKFNSREEAEKTLNTHIDKNKDRYPFILDWNYIILGVK